MQYLLPTIFGFAAGALAGFVLVYLFPGTFDTMLSQVIAGMVVGAIFGGVIGSISGELNASGDLGAHRVLIAGFFGAVGGFLGATKMGALWAFFKYMHWPTPI